MSTKKTLDHIVGVSGTAALSGLFIYRTINPLAVTHHPVMGRVEIGEMGYQLMSAGLAALCLGAFCAAVYKAVKYYNSDN